MAVAKRRCLILDDDKDDVELIKEYLDTVLPESWEVRCETAPFKEFSRYFDFDLLIIDERLGPFRGSEMSALLRRMHYTGGIVIVSGVKRGVGGFDAFIWKEDLEDLPDVLVRFFRKLGGKK